MKQSKFIIFFIALCYICVHAYKGYWKDPMVLKSDVVDYYSYLPSMFIYKDAGMKFIEDDPEFFNGKLWGYKLENGNYLVKSTMGMSILYAPFFLLSHLYALASPFPADGFSAPYSAGLTFSSLFYFILGLVFLRKFLLKYFSDAAVAVVLMAISLATNISLYLTMQPAFPHVYMFFLFSAFLLFTQKFYQRTGFVYSLLLGLCLGLISLIRPTNIIIAIVFLLWNIDSMKAIKTRILFWFRHWKFVLLMTISVVIVWIPQLIFWKSVTGYLFYYSYGEEGFFFMNPQISNVLFSFRKGWLLYTPVMIFAAAGFVYVYRKMRPLFSGTIIFFVLNLYIISSWWCWWYGGSYGHRAFIDSYPLMAIPLAAIVQHFILKGMKYKIIVWFVASVFVAHNTFQTIKYTNGAIHWDAMTKHAYMETLWRLNPTPQYFFMLQDPDYHNALMGLPEKAKDNIFVKVIEKTAVSDILNGKEYVTLVFHDFELHKPVQDAYVKEYFSNYVSHSGLTSYLLNSQYHYLQGVTIPLDEIRQLGITSVAADYYILSFDKLEDDTVLLIISIENEEESLYYWSASVTQSSFVLSQWNLRHLLVDLPADAPEGLMVKCYIWNVDGKAQAYIDDFRVYGIR
jgi:hypothetical protein